MRSPDQYLAVTAATLAAVLGGNAVSAAASASSPVAFEACATQLTHTVNGPAGPGTPAQLPRGVAITLAQSAPSVSRHSQRESYTLETQPVGPLFALAADGTQTPCPGVLSVHEGLELKAGPYTQEIAHSSQSMAISDTQSPGESTVTANDVSVSSTLAYTNFCNRIKDTPYKNRAFLAIKGALAYTEPGYEPYTAPLQRVSPLVLPYKPLSH